MNEYAIRTLEFEKAKCENDYYFMTRHPDSYRESTMKEMKKEITTAKCRDLIVETIINNMGKIDKWEEV